MGYKGDEKMERIEKRIAILYSLKKQKIVKALEKYQLSYEDYQIVMALHYAQGLDIEEVIKETDINSQFIQYVLENLIKKEYVEIDEHQKVFLTKKSKVLYPQIKRIVKECQDELESQMSTDEYHEIVEKLDRLIDLYE